MKSVGLPVSKPGASKPRFLTSSRPGVPIGWTVSDSPSGHDQPLLVAEARGHGGRDEEQDQPEVGEQRRHLRVLVAVAVDVRGPSSGRSPRGRGSRGRARRRATSAAATPVIAARSGRLGSKNGSGWTTRTSDTPRHSRGVRSSVQTTIEMTSTISADAEPRRAEDRERPEPLEHVDDPGPKTGS